MKNIMLPLGVDNFEELRTTGYYYIDKTYFIEELIQERFKVHLITRPRRFGKTLAISMLADFFDIRKDNRQIFEGLAVSENKKLCREWRNQWPVLFVTLKDIEDLSFAEAYAQLVFTISNLCIEHSYLAKSSRVDSTDKVLFLKLKNQTADKAAVKNSLLILTRMMSAHFGKPVILLIDEYDVLLAKANEYGYYAQMLNSRRAIILEIKHSQTKSAMEKDCETAVNQIAVQKYARDFLDGYKIIRCYGVSFFQKQCMVKYLEI